MANKAVVDGAMASGSLQRGKACLRCRKRKMRCDGGKPACQQCSRAKKGDACEYDDGKGKTRTQMLRENIARLEQRIRELEDPEYVSPSVTLYDPHIHSRSSSSVSSFESPTANHSVVTSTSPFQPGTHSPQGAWIRPQTVPTPVPSLGNELFFDEPQPQPPFELAQMLLDIFAPHKRQCGLEVNMARLRDSIGFPSQQRHPVLMNSIYLWACFISRPGALAQHENHYLSLALGALGDGLSHSEYVLDVIQASCLLSLYFLANGRVLEGSYHLSAAAALVVQCGLHTSVSRNAHVGFPGTKDGYDLKPSKRDPHHAERVLTFWQVYNLDRCWSVLLRRPALIPDGPDVQNSIHCPWPQSLSDYEAGHIDTTATHQTVRAFLAGEVVPGSFSVLALRAKASALYARADHLSTCWDPRMKASGCFSAEVQTLEQTIVQFASTLVPVHQLDAAVMENKYTLIVTHTLGHCAVINLYQRFSDDSISFNKCTRAAKAVVGIIKHITDRDFEYLDPIIGPCWSSAADILIRDLDTIESSWPLMDSSEVRHEISILYFALTSLSARFPIVGMSPVGHKIPNSNM
ncbi:hypothetical protein BD779DRAFT_1436091 [Infundibulicybe gibba]|nr:hypothetical protein BD779DRAFT_1436091 [Infundibulicybe gibba]